MEKVIPFMGEIIDLIYKFSDQMPLELFMVVGTLLEEVISPIPSPLVTTLAGSIAAGQGKGLWYTLIVLGILGAISKTIASFLFYYFADKLEDIVVTKYGKFFGVTHAQMESIGKRMSKKSSELWMVISLRAIPIVPGLPVSLVAGLIKMDVKTYLLGTFIGYIFRNAIFLYFGYSGVSAYNHILEGLDKTETVMKILIVLAVGGFIAWAYLKRRKMKM